MYVLGVPHMVLGGVTLDYRGRPLVVCLPVLHASIWRAPQEKAFEQNLLPLPTITYAILALYNKIESWCLPYEHLRTKHIQARTVY